MLFFVAAICKYQCIPGEKNTMSFIPQNLLIRCRERGIWLQFGDARMDCDPVPFASRFVSRLAERNAIRMSTMLAMESVFLLSFGANYFLSSRN